MIIRWWLISWFLYEWRHLERRETACGLRSRCHTFSSSLHAEHLPFPKVDFIYKAISRQSPKIRLCHKYLNQLSFEHGPFTLDDNDIIFLSSSVNGLIGNHATHFFLSSEMGTAPIPDDKNMHHCHQVWTVPTFVSNTEVFLIKFCRIYRICKIFFIKNGIWTHHLLCKRQTCHHCARKTEVAEIIIKFTPIHASVIYQIL